MSPADPTSPATAAGRARLTIHRTAPDDEGSRQIVCSLDDVYLGQLLVGQTLSREIDAGAHRLSINNTLFWKSLSFTALPGGHVEYTVKNLAWGGTLMTMLFVFFGAAPLKLAILPGPPRAGAHP